MRLAVSALLVFGWMLAQSCSVDEVDFNAKICPCDDGYSCDTVNNVCVLGNLDAGGDAGGAAGAAGAAGSGGCTSAQKLCGDVCVQRTNPSFGCGGDNCDPCPVPPHASAGCESGACGVGTCEDGRGDCNGEASDGCELEVVTSEHCGACQRTCSLSNASSSSCSATGTCVPVCAPGALDCGSPPATSPDDGCETNPMNSDQNCGLCGSDCTTQGGGAGFRCNSGACGCTSSAQCALSPSAAGTCNTGSGRCSCDGTSCAVGEACDKSGPTNQCRCNGGAGCDPSDVCCPLTGCTDVSNDPANCGGCGKACTGIQLCLLGACV
jgi:hypothetical protein